MTACRPASRDCAASPCGAQVGQSTAALQAEAAEWLIRRDGEAWHAQDELRWRQWLAQSSAHAAAYARAGRLWEELAGLKQVPELLPPAKAAAMASADRHGRWRSARRAWGGAGLCLAVLITVFAVSDGLPWLALQADQRSAVGEERLIGLPDGSQVRLAAYSAIALHYTATERRVELLKGAALFKARPVGGAPAERRPFVVSAADGATRALGTQFMVERLATHTRVIGVEHRVAVAMVAAPQTAVTLSPGQFVRYDRDGVGPVEALPAHWLAAEAKGMLVFERTRLDDVVQRLNRHFAAHIMVGSSALARREVSGVFPAADVEGALAALQAELGLRALRLPGAVLLY